MTLRPLAETLLEVVEALRLPLQRGLVVTEAEVALPLEVSVVAGEHELLITGSAPHTRFRSGVLPPVHLTRLRVELQEGALSESGRGE